MIQDNCKYISSRIYMKESSLNTRINFDLLRNVTIIDESMIITHSRQRQAMCTSSIATGVIILDLSKIYLTSLFFHLQSSLRDVQLLCTDTGSNLLSLTLVHCISDNQLFFPDSLCISFKTHNFVQDMIRTVVPFADLSNFPKDHVLYSNQFKSEFNRVKFDQCEKQIFRVFALKSKSYGISFYNDSYEKLTNKGIPKSITRMELTIADFEKVLRSSEELKLRFLTIIAKKHLLTTRQMEKTALNLRDSKRFILRCSIHSRPFGHVRNSRVGDKCLRCESGDQFP